MKILDFAKARQVMLGMNSRNIEFLRPHNKKKAVYIADSKLLTKKHLEEADIPTAKVYTIIATKKDLDAVDFTKLPDSFVVKPNRGFGGEGILITYARDKNGEWINSNGDPVGLVRIKAHIQDILDGQFSLSNTPDVAYIEERLSNDPLFKAIAYKGVPDIRVVVYNMVPIMAMLRLPTKDSQGKANLHTGGIGLGIDIATGKTTHAIQYDKYITLPGDKKVIEGFKIPNWDDILELSIRAQKASKLGYLGVDIVLAKDKGPVVLEVNARPGLSIQIANRAGLKDRLRRVRGLEVEDASQGIRISKELFAEHQPKKKEEKEEKQVLKTIETVYVYDVKEEDRIKVEARVDSGAQSSSLDVDIVKKLGYDHVLEVIENNKGLQTKMKKLEARKLEKRLRKKLTKFKDIKDVQAVHSASGSTVRVLIPLTIKIKNKKLKVHAAVIDRSHMKYPMIIGRTNLKGFLIDPEDEKESSAKAAK
ncbi:MAG: hypothetical protein HOJ15_03600 [Candidatus Jacksonbacteria bacterium]|jgi:alpha-L-glutamate ligase-like protein|nr:hypothetical protein [Candidatus Jacksonbacteria bacterium]MBT6301484.1 hypothetical protein [Candidatus Jacksonbacteria bacterium]MBT6954888.1 hypothetical protein [Candidatus Jacksonbacteria bacterium]MBT7008091.1 hypothetical protein [Candidatus Jacksonbacteria bacterium]MBT7338660.1 hypothetical protein [Candidatus Jacksonbacteria bacterium]